MMKKWLACMSIMIVIIVAPSSLFIHSPTLLHKQASGTFQVYYLDVGQGDSTCIRTPKKQHILIDGGDIDQGKRVLQCLKRLGIRELDVVIATHPHTDHIGGLIAVMKRVKVKSVYAPKVAHTSKTFKRFLQSVKSKNVRIKTAESGVSIPLDGVSARFVEPVSHYGKD